MLALLPECQVTRKQATRVQQGAPHRPLRPPIGPPCTPSFWCTALTASTIRSCGRRHLHPQVCISHAPRVLATATQQNAPTREQQAPRERSQICFRCPSYSIAPERAGIIGSLLAAHLALGPRPLKNWAGFKGQRPLRTDNLHSAFRPPDVCCEEREGPCQGPRRGGVQGAAPLAHR